MPLTRPPQSGHVVVTGAAGFLGSKLVARLSDAGAPLVRVLRQPSPGIEGGTDIVGDVRDKALWECCVPGASVVFHLAAQTSASVSDNDPRADWEHNVLPILHLLDLCAKEESKPAVVFASTATIFGIPDRNPVDESFPDRPLTAYDLHKKLAEDYLEHYVRRGLAVGTALRLPNVYGPGPLARGDRGVLNRMIVRALNGESLTVYGSGEQVRDYIYVDDVVEAFLAAARHAPALNGRHFVIGSGQGHPIAEAVRLVAERIKLRLGRPVNVSHVEPPGPRPAIEERDFVATPRSFVAQTGWRARVQLKDGIDRTIEAHLRERIESKMENA